MLKQLEFNYLENNLSFVDQLTINQKDFLIHHSQLVNFTKGQTIHYSENDCLGVLLIIKGTIRTYITSDEGREITLYRLKENEVCILSASCVLQTIDFDVFIEAQSEVTAIQISSPAFFQLSKENLHVELFSYKLASLRFGDVIKAMQQLLFTSFDKRLATFLLTETTQQRTNQLQITHEEIAKNLGTAREVVSRMLKHFSTKGLIVLRRGRIEIIDRVGLENYE